MLISLYVTIRNFLKFWHKGQEKQFFLKLNCLKSKRNFLKDFCPCFKMNQIKNRNTAYIILNTPLITAQYNEWVFLILHQTFNYMYQQKILPHCDVGTKRSGISKAIFLETPLPQKQTKFFEGFLPQPLKCVQA